MITGKFISNIPFDLSELGRDKMDAADRSFVLYRRFILELAAAGTFYLSGGDARRFGGRADISGLPNRP